MKVHKIFFPLLSIVLLCNTNIVTAASGSTEIERLQIRYIQNKDNFAAAHEYAVALARQTEYDKSLAILQQLIDKFPENKTILYDYIVILGWAGKYQDAVTVYEEKLSLLENEIPMYVKTGTAGAYYRLGQFEKAQKLFHQAAVSGDHKAKQWEAEALMRLGKIREANVLYSEMLSQDNNDVDVYVSRAAMLILNNDFITAAADIENAIQLMPNDLDGINRKRQICAKIAPAFIRAGDYMRGIMLLKPYVEDGTANAFMQGDYILGLYLSGNYKAAISEASRLWPDYEKIPIFGLQALADSYLRSGQAKPAMAIYKQILQRDSKLSSIKISLAYAQIIIGDVDTAIGTYDEALSDKPKLADIAIGDAVALINKGRYQAGKDLYKLIVSKFPDNIVYRQKFAEALKNNGLVREAYKEYNELAKNENSELYGTAGILQSSVSVGDYRNAQAAIDGLNKKYPNSPVTADALTKYDLRYQGEVESYYFFANDHKGNESRKWGITGTQNIGGSLSVLAASSVNRFHDKTTGENATLNMGSLGTRYTDMNYDVTAWLVHYNNNGSFTGYRTLSNFYLSDNTSLRVNLSRIPLEDVQALNPNQGGRIMSQNNTIGISRQVGKKSSYDVNLTKSFLSDGNQATSINTEYTKKIFTSDKKVFNWLVFASRDSYKNQFINGASTVYESPSLRTAYGTGLIGRWTIPKGYWEGTAMLDWGSDRPEPTDFNPYFRLEYGHYFNPSSMLVLGMEYGLRTNRINNSSKLLFSNREYTFNYRCLW